MSTTMMSKTSIALILAFAAVFGAGTLVGTARHGGRQTEPTPPESSDGSEGRGGGGGASWLSRELGLSPEQRDQMRQIWSELMNANRATNAWEQRREIQRQREQAVREMLGADQQQKFDQINEEYDQKLAELGESQRDAFRQAVERTRQILTPEQAAKYDEFLKRRGRGGGPRPFGKSSSTAPTPATEPSPSDS